MALSLSVACLRCVSLCRPGQAEGHGQTPDSPQQPPHPAVSSGKPQIIQFMKPNPVFRLERVIREITHSLLQLW